MDDPTSLNQDLNSTGATYIFSVEDFFELSVLGSGGDAKVYKGCFSKSEEVAVKYYFKPMDKNATNEIDLFKRLKHENIVKLYGLIYDTKKTLCMGFTMEYMPMGSLHDVIHDHNRKYHIKKAYSWIQQAGSGLKYLHSQGILHRDVKPTNMLLGEKMDLLKLSDFGLARPMDTASITACVGTYNYMAPEVLRSGKYGSKADIYSFAVIIWEIIHRKTPYCHLEKISLYKKISQIEEGIRPMLDKTHSSDIISLIEKGWHPNPESRPDLDDFIFFAEAKSKSEGDKSDGSSELVIAKQSDFLNSKDVVTMNDFDAKDNVEEYRRGYFSGLTFIAKGSQGVVFKGNLGASGAVAIKVHHAPYEKKEVQEIRQIARVGGKDIINNSLKQDKFILLNWLHQIALGINYMHVNGLIHRDMKPQNVMITDNFGLVKIIDFGLMRKENESMTGSVGTVTYMAPEIMEGNKYSIAADVYSFAKTAHFIFSGFEEKENNVLKYYRRVAEGYRPKLGFGSIDDIIESCWKQNPQERPPMKEVITNIQQIKFDEELKRKIEQNAAKTMSPNPVKQVKEQVEKLNKEVEIIKKLDKEGVVKLEKVAEILEKLNENMEILERRKKEEEFERLIKLKKEELERWERRRDEELEELGILERRGKWQRWRDEELEELRILERLGKWQRWTDEELEELGILERLGKWKRWTDEELEELGILERRRKWQRRIDDELEELGILERREKWQNETIKKIEMLKRRKRDEEKEEELKKEELKKTLEEQKNLANQKLSWIQRLAQFVGYGP